MPEIAPLALAELTTLRVGGRPRRVIEARTRDDLVDALRETWSTGDDWLVVEDSSNQLVGDEEFDGTVVLVRTQGIERLPSPRADFVRESDEAGHGWDDLVAYAAAEGLSGIVAMSGIPGTVGAAPVQNIGAYGQEIVETLIEVELIDEATGDVSVVTTAELGLGFRTSVLKNHYGSVAERSAVVLSVTLELREVGHGPFALSGAQLRQALGVAEDEGVTLEWVRQTVLATRARKGMVLDDADPDTYSAGSFFQNAIVSASFARTLPPECPRWPVSTTAAPLEVADRVIPLASYDGYVPPPVSAQPDVKVSAAWLIEHSGLRKGFHLPRSRAGLSTKHALALTNRGSATAEEIAELARYIQSRVQSEFGLILQPEPVLVGVEL